MEVLATLACSAHTEGRSQAHRWLERAGATLAKEPAALARMLLSVHADTQLFAASFVVSTPLSEATWGALLEQTASGLLGLGEGENDRAARAREALITGGGARLGRLPEGLVRALLEHPLPEVQALGSEALLLARSAPTDELIQQLLDSPHAVVRGAGARLFETMPDGALLQRPLLLARLLAHAQPDLRASGRRLLRRLLAADEAFAPVICGLLLDALLRNKLPQGVGEGLGRLILEDLHDALVAVSPERIARLLRSGNRQAQELGALLVLKRDLAGAFTVDEMARLCDHETRGVREIAWMLMEKSIVRVRTDMAGLIRVLDSSWDDTRAWAFQFLRERFSEEHFTLDVLVAIQDSVRPDVQALGRELLGLYFREEDGPQLLLRLSEHPTPAAQLAVTDYLDRFASGEPGYIRGLMPYFSAVLGQVNRGRVARVRVITFLEEQARANLEIAEEVLPLLHRATASIAVETRALALAAIAAIGQAHPTLSLPVPKIAPEVRHGVSLRLPRLLRRGEPRR